MYLCNNLIGYLPCHTQSLTNIYNIHIQFNAPIHNEYKTLLRIQLYEYAMKKKDNEYAMENKDISVK